MDSHLSDSEDDADYIPEVGADSDSENSEIEKTSKLHESSEKNEVTEEDRIKEKLRREELWKSFQSSVPSTVNNGTSLDTKMIRIIKKYMFAGEEVTEVCEVAEDSSDARKCPRWTPPEVDAPPTPHGRVEHSGSPAPEPSTQKEPSSPTAPLMAAEAPTEQSVPEATTDQRPSTSSTTRGSTSTVKRPGPRKPKVVLAAVPSTKTKKLSTLDKSAMDWRAHLQAGSTTDESGSPSTTQGGTSSLRDELEANRRSGGYLEKVEFLDRVGKRREEIFEQDRKSKRRK